MNLHTHRYAGLFCRCCRAEFTPEVRQTCCGAQLCRVASLLEIMSECLNASLRRLLIRSTYTHVHVHAGVTCCCGRDGQALCSHLNQFCQPGSPCRPLSPSPCFISPPFSSSVPIHLHPPLSTFIHLHPPVYDFLCLCRVALFLIYHFTLPRLHPSPVFPWLLFPPSLPWFSLYPLSDSRWPPSPSRHQLSALSFIRPGPLPTPRSAAHLSPFCLRLALPGKQVRRNRPEGGAEWQDQWKRARRERTDTMSTFKYSMSSFFRFVAFLKPTKTRNVA